MQGRGSYFCYTGFYHSFEIKLMQTLSRPKVLAEKWVHIKKRRKQYQIIDTFCVFFYLLSFLLPTVDVLKRVKFGGPRFIYRSVSTPLERGGHPDPHP